MLKKQRLFESATHCHRFLILLSVSVILLSLTEEERYFFSCCIYTQNFLKLPVSYCHAVNMAVNQMCIVVSRRVRAFHLYQFAQLSVYQWTTMWKLPGLCQSAQQLSDMWLFLKKKKPFFFVIFHCKSHSMWDLNFFTLAPPVGIIGTDLGIL